MKCTILSIAVILSCFELKAQQEYFIFIQETSRKPFYIRIGEESHSSSAGGHLILSNMKDSIYNLFIGFPKSRYPEQSYRVVVNKKDRGFDLKNINGMWQLFDLQSLQLIKPVIAEQRNELLSKKTDSYSQLMAGVVDDSAVLYTSITKEDVIKKEETVVKMEAGKNEEAEKKQEPVKQEETVVKIEAEKKEEGENKQEPLKKEETVVKMETEKKEEADKKQEPVKQEDTVVKMKVEKKDEGEKKQESLKKEETVVKIEAEKKEDSVKKVPERKAEIAIVEEQEKKNETTKNPAGIKTPEPVPAKSSAGTTPVGPVSYRDKRDIIRFSMENIEGGKLVIYLDRTGPVTDTIRIIIPRL